MLHKLLANWIENGYAVEDCGDGAWNWTKKGKNEISDLNRMFLSNMLDGGVFPDYLIDGLMDEGFNSDGMVMI